MLVDLGWGSQEKGSCSRVGETMVSRGEQVFEVFVSQITSSVSCVGPSPALPGQTQQASEQINFLFIFQSKRGK